MSLALMPVPGIRVASTCAGVTSLTRDDLVLFELVEGSQCAAVFTQNAFCAAPVVLAKAHLKHTAPRYWLINSGNANAGTGEAGLQSALACCQALADITACEHEQVLPFSTGVIGVHLPQHKVIDALPEVFARLSSSGWASAAQGIMTTDTVPKGVSRVLELDGKTVTLTGIAKGAGMICPNMATMLGFIATDAVIDQARLQRCLTQAVAHSFNCITVDGDTSTNDACVLVATQQSGVVIDAQHQAEFFAAVCDVCVCLAKSIVMDAEGATKFVTIQVDQAADEAEAKCVAYTIAHSPLVKTALFASDPNWGRILAAVGRADIAALDVSRVQIYLDDVCIVSNGGVSPTYTEAQGQRVMSLRDITIRVSLGRGQHQSTVWTSDLSYDYVKINAEYRT